MKDYLTVNKVSVKNFLSKDSCCLENRHASALSGMTPTEGISRSTKQELVVSNTIQLKKATCHDLLSSIHEAIGSFPSCQLRLPTGCQEPTAKQGHPRVKHTTITFLLEILTSILLTPAAKKPKVCCQKNPCKAQKHTAHI